LIEFLPDADDGNAIEIRGNGEIAIAELGYGAIRRIDGIDVAAAPFLVFPALFTETWNGIVFADDLNDDVYPFSRVRTGRPSGSTGDNVRFRMRFRINAKFDFGSGHQARFS
jgi:hypothetical protein